MGGEPDVISISNESEKSDAQRQDGDEVRHRREDAVTMEHDALKQKLLDAWDDVAARLNSSDSWLM